MGFCTSPWFADMSLEFLELHSLNKLKNSILLYKRYVDDCFLIVKRDQINNIINTFNNYNKHLHFTVAAESNNKISFSDIEISRVDLLLTNW